MTLPGRVALVTGAGSGIGRAIALVFAQRGASVVVADVDEASAISTTRAIDGNAVAVCADVVDADAVARMVQTAVDRFGGLDCAVNNAGIAPDAKPFTEHTLAEWQRTIDVDLTGVFLCMQHELRQFSAQGRGGAIVNISSAAGTVPAPGQPQYTAAKHGVLGLTKQAAQEFAAQGIRVNAVHARPDRDRPDARVPRCAPRPGRAHAAPPADGPDGDARGDRADGRVAVLRRRFLRQRRVVARRRRPHRPLTGAAGLS